jgi:hypothetical protein
VRRLYMSRMVATAFAIAGADPSTAVEEPKGYLQKDIATAKIIETSRGYAVDVSILASDFEEMFQKSFNERRGLIFPSQEHWSWRSENSSPIA